MRALLLALLAGCAAAASGTVRAAPLSQPEVAFEGNERFSAQRLRMALQRFDVNIDDRVTSADDAAFFLREFYFEQGFPEARVDYDFSPRLVVFRVSEGGRAALGSLAFEGGEGLSRERIEAIFRAAVRQALRRPVGPLPFVESALDSAAERLRAAFVGEGFLDARVEIAAELNGVEPVPVTVTVLHGTRYRVGSVRFTGTSEERALRDAVGEFVGRPFRPGTDLKVRSRALDWLRANGHLKAAVAVGSVRHPDGTVDLALSVVPGRMFTIGRVDFSGLNRTHRWAAERRFGIRRGSRYDASALDAAERRMWFTGAFSSVVVRPHPQEGETVDLDVEAVEGRARQLAGTLGYSEWERGFATVRYTDRNAFGSLNRFTLEGFVSQRGFGGEAALTNPWLFGENLGGTVTAFAQRRELPAYRAVQYGASAGLAGRRDERGLTGWNLLYEWRVVTDTDVFSGDPDDAIENYQLGMISFSQQLDTRNDLLAPMSGYNLRYEAGVAAPALFGDVSFFKATGTATLYFPLREILPERPYVPLFLVNHRVGVIVPFGGTESVPVPERFFLGGPDSVRSFQLDGMAPRDPEGVPTGGQAFFQVNVEFQYPIWQGLFGAVFTDFGNLAATLDEFTFSQTRIAPGAGLRIYTPIGTLRADYALNLVREDGDPLGNWQFGIGFTF